MEKYEFEVFEPETPGRGVSSVFICLYSVLGRKTGTKSVVIKVAGCRNDRSSISNHLFIYIEIILKKHFKSLL